MGLQTKIKVEHAPGYGQFYVQDPKKFDVLRSATISANDLANGFAAGPGIIILFCKSEDEPVSIELELAERIPEHDLPPFFRLALTELVIHSNQVVLAACPDGPEYGAFGKLEVRNGTLNAWIGKSEIEGREKFKIILTGVIE